MNRSLRLLSGLTFLVLGLVVYGLLFSLSSCGKVTQTRDPEEAEVRTSFEAHYTLPLMSQSTLAEQLKEDPKLPTSNVMLFDGKTIYSVVFGIKEAQNLEQMAWGQAIPSSKEVSVSENVTLEWESQAKNKNNVTINRSMLKEVYIDLKTPTDNVFKWDLKATKIKYGAKGYLFGVFSSKDRFRFFVVDEKTATTNSLVTKGELSEYETFASSLYLMHLESVDFLLTKAISYEKVKAIFTSDFYALFGTPIYTNTINKFDVKRPRFLISFKGLDMCLSVLDLVKNTDKEETLVYVDQLKPEVLDKKAKAILLEAIRNYTFEEVLSDEESLISSTANVVTTGNAAPTENIAPTD